MSTLWKIEPSMLEKAGDQLILNVPETYDRIECSAIDDIRSELTAVNAPSVIELEPYTFFNCEKLTYVELGTDVSCIPEGTFLNCSSLNEVYIDGVDMRIEDSAFSGCEKLSTFYFENVVFVGDSAFADSGLEEDFDSASIEHIGANAFRNTKLKVVRINQNVSYIGENAFADNKDLSYISLRGGDEDGNALVVESGAFANCAADAKISKPSLNPQVVIATDAFDASDSLEGGFEL